MGNMSKSGRGSVVPATTQPQVTPTPIDYGRIRSILNSGALTNGGTVNQAPSPAPTQPSPMPPNPMGSAPPQGNLLMQMITQGIRNSPNGQSPLGLSLADFLSNAPSWPKR